MKIILTEDARKIGRKNEIKDVSDGYAKNFLIPKKMAVLATDAEIRKIREFNEVKEKKVSKKQEAVQEFFASAKNKVFIFHLKTGKNGEVFNSVSSDEIIKTLKRDAPEIADVDFKIRLERPIKKIGEFEIEIDFGNGAKGSFKIKIEAV